MPLAKTASASPRSGSAPRSRGRRLARRHHGDCATLARHATCRRPARRAHARAREHPVREPERGGDRGARPFARARVVRARVRGEDAFVWARPRRDGQAARRARGPLRHGSGAGQPPGPDRGRRRRRARRERHEGRARGDDRARAGAGRRGASSRRSTWRCSPSARRSCRPRTARCRRSSTRSRLVHEAELAILLEPTDNTIQAGCLGNLNARIVFHGVSGHSARPWLAENAIEKALDGLRPFAAIEPRPVEIGGLTFTEVVEHHADRGRDRDQRHPRPGRRDVNFRYAPDRSPSSADAYLRSLVPDGASYEPCRRLSARPRRHRLAARPAAAGGRRPRARAEAGVDERRRLHLARDRRRQLRARRDALRPPARRAGRDRRARAGLRGALGLPHRYASDACPSPPSSSARRRIRSSAWTRRARRSRRAASR